MRVTSFFFPPNGILLKPIVGGRRTFILPSKLWCTSFWNILDMPAFNSHEREFPLEKFHQLSFSDNLWGCHGYCIPSKCMLLPEKISLSFILDPHLTSTFSNESQGEKNIVKVERLYQHKYMVYYFLYKLSCFMFSTRSTWSESYIVLTWEKLESFHFSLTKTT